MDHPAYDDDLENHALNPSRRTLAAISKYGRDSGGPITILSLTKEQGEIIQSNPVMMQNLQEAIKSGFLGNVYVEDKKLLIARKSEFERGRNSYGSARKFR